MRPILIYFRETHLDENNKFTLDFSDHEFVQEIEFLSKNKYYITSLNCKLKLKKYIYEDEKFKKLSAKSKVLLEKGAQYLCNIDYLMLTSEWYIKDSNDTYRFKLYPKIIGKYSYKYKFWDTIEKTIRDGQIYLPYSHFLGKGFNFEREVIKGLNLIVQLNEEQTLIESFFLHRSPRGGTEDLGGKAYYRDINLYFVYVNNINNGFHLDPNFLMKQFAKK